MSIENKTSAPNTTADQGLNIAATHAYTNAVYSFAAHPENTIEIVGGSPEALSAIQKIVGVGSSSLISAAKGAAVIATAGAMSHLGLADTATSYGVAMLGAMTAGALHGNPSKKAPTTREV